MTMRPTRKCYSLYLRQMHNHEYIYLALINLAQIG